MNGSFKTVRLVVIGSLSHSFDSPVSIIAQLIRTIGSSFDSQSVPFFDDGDDSEVGTYCLTTVFIWMHLNYEYLDVSKRKVINSRPLIISFFKKKTIEFPLICLQKSKKNIKVF